MHTQTKHNRMLAARRVYQRPQVKVLGRVGQLTLKAGSLTDGLNPGSFG